MINLVVVRGEPVFPAGNVDLRAADTVSISANQRAVAGISVHVLLKRVVAQNNIGVNSVPVGNLQTYHSAAEISQPCDCAPAVGKSNQPALVASEKTEFTLGNAHVRFLHQYLSSSRTIVLLGADAGLGAAGVTGAWLTAGAGAAGFGDTFGASGFA